MNFKKKLLSITVTGSMLVSSLSLAFQDVESHWAKDYINDLSSQEIINGYEDGSFRPQSFISREEASQILSNYLGKSPNTGAIVPADSQNRWSTPAIQNLMNHGIINGYEDGTFRPANQITRAEFAKMIHSVLNSRDVLKPVSRKFPDISQSWARQVIEVLGGNRVINGYDDGTFRPANSITRAEVASIMYFAENPKPVSNTFETATVVSVTDGDTIKVSINGEQHTIRMIGVDTPETVHPSKPVEYFGPEASAYAKSMLEGKTVYLQKDVSNTDQYGRLLRYVWTYRPDNNDPTIGEIKTGMFNALLLINGYAKPSTFPPDVKYADLFVELTKPAQSAGIGVWGQPIPHPEPDPEPQPQPEKGLIKGNISSTGEKIYHVPGGAFYDRTVIDESQGERWFTTEAEAIAAGWRKSSR